MIELIFSSKPKDWLIAEATFPKKSKNEPWKVSSIASAFVCNCGSSTFNPQLTARKSIKLPLLKNIDGSDADVIDILE